MESAKRWSLVVLLVLGVPVGCAQLIGADESRELKRSAIVPKEDAFAPVPDAAGIDAAACGANEKRCNNTCVPKTDPTFGCNNEGCEPCNLQNAATIACRESDGKCVAGTCVNGYASCNQAHLGCKFDFSDPATCGDCNRNCVGSLQPLCTPTGCGSTCPGGTQQCGSSCVDLQTHPKYCGSCNIACPGATNGDPGCKAGKCYTICRPGFAHCDGTETGPCVALQTFYVDADGDGFGDSNANLQKKLGCPGQGGPGYAPVAGDCNDGNKEVFPGQTAYFPAPYKNNANALSYDYDCNGIEQDRTAHFPGCAGDCKGAGIGPAGSGRTGMGVNDYCGSTTNLSCEPGLQPAEPGMGMAIHPLTSSSGQSVSPSCALTSAPTGANGCH